MRRRSRIAHVATELFAPRGFALPLAVAALFVVAAVVSWSVLLGLYAFRGGQNTIRLAQALSSAEEGALLQIQDGSWPAHVHLAVGARAEFSGAALADNGWYRGEVKRVSETLFLVAAEGFDPARRARQRAGLLVQLQPLDLDVRAALDTRGRTELNDLVRVSGRDEPPPNWRCPPEPAPVAGVRVPARDVELMSRSGCNDGACITGTPPLLMHEGPETAMYAEGRIAELEQFATLVLNGGHVYLRPEPSGGECSADSPANWGAPRAPAGACGRRLPFVYSRGDLVIRGGRGQALLVVDGDLAIVGDAELFGLILVGGSLVAAGDARIRGAVLVANSSDGITVLGERASISYSSCVVGLALAAAGVPMVLQERPWLRLE